MPEPVSSAAPWKRWLPFSLWLLLISGIIVCADRGKMRALFALVARFQGSDKALHFLGVGTLAFLLDYALAGRTVKGFQLGGLIIAIAITLEEISQIWIPTRHFDYGDIASNIAGICCAGWILKRWFARFAA